MEVILSMSCFAVIKRLKHCLIFLVLICGMTRSLIAKESVYSWDFSNCEIRDILYAVSLDSGISIYADDTVNGKGDLKFAGCDFAEAFDSFLIANRLFVVKDEKIWIVSKFRMSCEKNLYSVDAYDMTPSLILEKISKEMNCVVTYDNLPGNKLSLHFSCVDEQGLLDSLAKRFGEYEVLKSDYGYHFSKKNNVRTMGISDGFVKVLQNDDGFLIDVKGGKFSDVIEKLFCLEVPVKSLAESKENRSFCLLSNGDNLIQRTVFRCDSFTEALEKICFQNGFSFVCDSGIFYIFADSKSKNSLIYGERVWQKFSLKFTKAQDFLPFLMKKVGNAEVMVLPDVYSFLCFINESEKESVIKLIDEVDIEIDNYVINLKYLKPSEVMQYLPPEVDKSTIFLADDNSKLYFRGTKSGFDKLMKQIEVCDQPVKRISYDLLILQYDDTNQNSWSSSFEAGRLKLGDRNKGSIILGNVMNLNLSVVSCFGLKFAYDLQSSIEESKTKVFVDTTLHGVSGKKISFQSTNTYRYRDNNVDPETGKPVYSGITREIASGIKLEISGWVSGDGMITSSVVASVSRQGVDTSSSTGNPPPTSEKMVTTEVRGKSGEPIILSGLTMESDNEQGKRTPLISKIPLIGNLFKSKQVTKENTQMVIYLVPHLDDEQYRKDENLSFLDEQWAESRIEEFCKKLEIKTGE